MTASQKSSRYLTSPPPTPPPASKKGTHGEACNTVTPFKALTPCSLATLHPTPRDRRRQPEMCFQTTQWILVERHGSAKVSQGSIPVYMLLMCPV